MLVESPAGRIKIFKKLGESDLPKWMCTLCYPSAR
jgi:hypothetical protein